MLSQRVDDRLFWDLSVVVGPLTGTDREAPEILDVCRERMLKESWDLAVCLTDLPVYRSGRLIVADASAVLFALASISAIVFVPSGYLQSTLGHPLSALATTQGLPGWRPRWPR